jgi:hypothetical protein
VLFGNLRIFISDISGGSRELHMVAKDVLTMEICKVFRWEMKFRWKRNDFEKNTVL